MNNKKDIPQLIETFIRQERNTTFNPFISTRIMAAIEKNNFAEVKRIAPVWKTVIAAFSLGAALVTGIATGGLYQSKNDTNDVVLINDRNMEHLDFYIEIGKE